MTAAVIVATALVVFAVIAVWARGGLDRPRRHRKPATLPHRPTPDTPRPAGPRHRREDAHTASLSATAVLRALRDEADQAQQHMADAVKRETGQ